MEKKTIVIIGAVATVAALVILSGVAYAAVGPFSGQGTHNSHMMGHNGYGGSMMGRGAASFGGMMGDNHTNNWSCSCMENCTGSASLP